MNIHSKHITSYIDFLKKSGYTITLHGDMVNNKSNFMKYNYHQNPYCHYVKSVYGKWSECISRQNNICRHCESGPFFGSCYAGVGEYIYPVMFKEKFVGFISVSGYIAENSQEKAKHFATKNGISKKELSSLMDKYLSKEIPDISHIDSIINPLVFMLEEYLTGIYKENSGDEQLYHEILRYITENCHDKITMSTLSQKYSYSVSKLSHLFLKKSGKSLPEYIEQLRLDEAKWYLSNSNSPISEIALFLGYSSSNYFSMVFKKKFNQTPGEYRKNTIDIPK